MSGTHMRTGFIWALVASFLLVPFAHAADEIRVPSNLSNEVNSGALPLDCTPATDRVFITVGRAAIAIPKIRLVTIVPKEVHLEGRYDESKATKDVLMVLPDHAGCKTTPVVAVEVVIPGGSQALWSHLALADAPGPSAADDMAGLRKARGCPPLGEDRLVCEGNTQIGGETVKIKAVVATTEAANASDGTPLFSICVEYQGAPLCEASGSRTGLKFKAVLKSRTLPSVEEMQAVYAAIDKEIAMLKRDAIRP